MHVVHLETGRRLYGGARQALTLACGLSARGVRNTFVCAAGSLVAVEATRLGLTVQSVPMRGDPDILFAQRFTRLLRELKPDVVHVHSRRGADWFGGYAARRAGVPALLTRRVDRQDGIIDRRKYRFYRRVVAISGAIRAQLEAAGVPSGRLSLIRSAIDTNLEPSWSRERFIEEFKLEPDQQIVGCVAQFIDRKGHRPLLQAWARVVAACPQAKLVLFGRGRRAESLRDDAFNAGLFNSVIMAGFRPDLRAFLGRLDVLVHAALAEGLGIAVMEAQAAGVPVVAFNAGGVPEIVADGRSGHLVPVGDTAALAAALIGLLKSEDRRLAMGAAAREWAASEFRVADMVDAYMTLYGELSGSSG